jgi:large subunit ribosomal protein L25
MDIGGFMKLKTLNRSIVKKSETKRIRREGDIPSVLYVRGKATDNLIVKGSEFEAVLRNAQPGRLSTMLFTLVGQDGKERRAILKEIQYEPTTYHVQHLDFEELFDDVKIKVKVPIECTGAVDCAGVKLGGVLRQVIRYMRVSCLPKDIPSAFQLDVKHLMMMESKRLSDLEIPNTVRPIANLHEVAVVIAKR